MQNDFLLIFAASITALWSIALWWTRHCLRKQIPLAPLNYAPPKQPFVSILVPARNEAHRILEKSVSSLLAQSYENYELIVLNDRSTDETGKILQNIQNDNSKLKIIDGAEPIEGWLGKPHALQQALRHARGAWILTTDADIIFSPEAVSTAIFCAERENFDALTLLPGQIYGSFWETLFMPVFIWFCILRAPLHRVNDPQRNETLGAGNFFMFRRDALKKIGGFEAVKAEVAEDLKLAEIIKTKGFKLRVEYAPDLISTRMYSGFRETWEGFGKNLFPAMNFSLLRTALSALSIFLFGVLLLPAAFIFLIAGNFLIFTVLFVAYVLQISVFALVQREWRGNVLYALLAPFGLLMFLAILLNSALKVSNGKGVTWKGRVIYEKGGIAPPINE